MNIKSYQAYSMAEALAAVKQDLGQDALILQTRSFRRGGVLGLGARTVVEVTATASREKPQRRRTPQSGASTRSTPPQAAAARRAYAPSRPQASAGAAGGTGTSVAPQHEVAELIATSLRGDGEGQSAAAPRRAEQRGTMEPEPERGDAQTEMLQALRGLLDSARDRRATAAAATAGAARAVAETSPVQDQPEQPPPGHEPAVEPVARRYILHPAEAAGDGAEASGVFEAAPQTSTAVAEPPAPPAPSGGSRSSLEDAMQRELATIRHLVGQVLERQAPAGEAPAATLPPHLFDIYLRLVEQEFSEEIAAEIVEQVRLELAEEQLESASTVREAVTARLAARVPVAGDPMPRSAGDGRPLTIALIGPTGVGKTTTLAKLAATYKLRHQLDVGLITADTYRIAAVEQLRTYAEIIGLPLQVALTPADMHQSVQALAGCQVILIDTAGRSQKDSARLDDLRRFLQAARPHQVHLVLAATAGRKVLEQESAAFGSLGVDRVILSKLDEAVCLGPLLELVGEAAAPVSLLTTGQEVPDHLEPASGERLAALLLDREVGQ